jgi:hypothetical protein
MAIFAAIVGAIIAFTFLAGGAFSLGTRGGLPFLNVGFRGATPQAPAA